MPPKRKQRKLRTKTGGLKTKTATTHSLKTYFSELKKEGKEKRASPAISQTQTSLMKSLVNMDTVYKFRLSLTGTSMLQLLSNSSGICAGYENADPSGGSGSTWTAYEWVDVSAMFNEVKLVEFILTFCPAQTTSTTLVAGSPLAVSGNLLSQSAAPSTISSVLDNADAKLYNLVTDRSQHGYRHRIKGTSLGWASTSSPNPGGFAGVTGAIQYYGNGYNSSVIMGYLWIEGIYAFRSRV